MAANHQTTLRTVEPPILESEVLRPNKCPFSLDPSERAQKPFKRVQVRFGRKPYPLPFKRV